MCGHVSLLCLCLLFVSSSVQGGQENLPSTWTRIVRQVAKPQLEENKEGAEKSIRFFAEQISICNSRNLALQTKLDDEKEGCEETCLKKCNTRTHDLQAILKEKEKGMERILQVYAVQVANLNTRLDEATQKVITTSVENLRLKQQLEESTTKFGRLEGQLSVTTGELKTKISDLMICDIEPTALREKFKQTTESVEVMNQEIKNQIMEFQKEIYEVILNATNLQTVYVKEVTKQLEQDFSKMNTSVMETVLQNKADLISTSDKIVQEISKGNSEISRKSDNLLQEFTSAKTKIDEGFLKMTQERDSKYDGLKSKQREILQVIQETKIHAENAAMNGPHYFSSDTKMSWQDAQKYCRSRNLNLVTIESAAENQIISNRMKELGMGWTWIGGTDEAVEGTWRWIGMGQTLTFTNWWRSQPSGGREENCMDIYSDGTWGDNVCSTALPFICEI